MLMEMKIGDVFNVNVYGKAGLLKRQYLMTVGKNGGIEIIDRKRI